LVKSGDGNIIWIEVFVVSLVVDGSEGQNEGNFSTSGHVDEGAHVAVTVGNNIDLGVLRNHWAVTRVRGYTVNHHLKSVVGNVKEAIGDDVPFLVEDLNGVVVCRDEPADVLLNIGWDTQDEVTIVDGGVEDDLSHVVSAPDSKELLLVSIRLDWVAVLVVDVDINSNIAASSLHVSDSSFLELVVTTEDQELGAWKSRLVKADIESAGVGAWDRSFSALNEEFVVS
jgi:hypothetical protein